MDIITGNVGWIEVICGPMFSGKSEELIRRLRRAMIARKRVEVFKPAIDNRYSDDEIVSHGDLRMRSEVVKNSREITERIDWRAEVVGIDEANFMGEDLVEVAQRLADSGKQVIIAGLDTDYLGRPFSPMPDLLGRVMSCLMCLMAGSQVLAMFVAAPVAEKAGIRNLYFGSAAMLLAIGVIGHYKLPAAAPAAQAAEAD